MSFPTPWHVSISGGDRVSVLDADGRVVTEVYPAQARGKVMVPPDLPEKVIVALRIARAVSFHVRDDEEYLRAEARRLIDEATVHESEHPLSKPQYLAAKWPDLFGPPSLHAVETA
jgi:hypothetical protein